MELFRAHIGEGTWLRPTTSGRVGYTYDCKDYVFEGSFADDERLVYGAPPCDRGPFERADFGDRDRLAWPAGACAIEHDTNPVYWNQRFALWREPIPSDRFSESPSSRIVAIDATQPLVVRIELPVAPFAFRDVLVGDGKLWFANGPQVVWFEIAALAALFDRTTGPLRVRVHELYPRRDRERERVVTVRDVINTDARVHSADGRDAMTIPAVLGLARGITDVTLHDELWKNHFLEITIPGYPRRKLYADDPPRESSFETRLDVDQAIDPAGDLVKASGAARMEELDRVFGLLADDPADDAARLVLVDVLEDAGEPYARCSRACSRAKRACARMRSGR